MYRFETTMSVYIPHMNSFQAIMQPGILYTHISYYWHMPLNTYACHIAHVCPTAIVLLCTYRLHITAYIYQTSINCNIYLLHYCKICASNKYAHQVSHIRNIPKWHDTLLWRKYANIHATYEVAIINDVARITRHRQQLMMQDDDDDVTAQWHI